MALQVLDDHDHDPQHQHQHQHQHQNNNKPTTTTTTFNYFCKICKRGFGCGRALGGHMRAHGIGAEADDVTTGSNINDGNDQDSSAGTADWVDEEPPGSNKRMYALRTNPNRLKSSCRVCENCGLEFSSWKSFLEHGKCSSNVENNSHHHYMHNNNNTMGGSDEEDGFGGWSKGKRSKRSKYGSLLNLNCPLSEEEDLANCLVMLSSARVDHNYNHSRPLVLETEESCSVSASKEEEDHRKPEFFVPKVHDQQQIDYKAKGVASSKGLFECKACKKVFNSHQALGGHRASHKKVKGCYAAKNDNNFDENVVEDDVLTNDNDYLITSKSTFEYETNDPPVDKRKSKVHECSICHRIFSSGQALGGHKRCHWVTSSSNSSEQHQISSAAAAAAAAAATSISFHQFNDQRASSFNIHQRVPKFNDHSHNKQQQPHRDLNLSVNGGDNIKGMQKDFENVVDTRICLQPWTSLCANENINHNEQQNQQQQQQQKKINNDESNDSKVVKLAKLSDLKDDDSSTSWLQVGIGSSTSNAGKDP